MITKEQAWELEPEELTKIIPREWIGQGYGYKNIEFDWNSGNPDEIIYVPEYSTDDNGNIEWGSCYSKQDFIDMCDGTKIDASYLFDAVDWQHPSSLFNELLDDEELNGDN